MGTFGKNKGFTLIEVMIALAIVVIVGAVFLSIAQKLETSGNELLTKSTINVLETALEQFEISGYQLRHADKSPYDNHEHNGITYLSYSYPPDCRDYHDWFEVNPKKTFLFVASDSDAKWRNIDEVFEDIFRFDFSNEPTVSITATYTDKTAEKTDNRYWAGSLSMLVVLNKVPACKDILGAISTRNIQRTDETGAVMALTIDSEPKEIYLITDAWGKPLKYWYDGAQAFPIIQSAGADGKFDTADDIVNSK